MTRHNAISMTINAANNGRPEALQDLLTYAALELRIPLDRIVRLAKRQFGIPKHISWRAIYELCPELIQ